MEIIEVSTNKQRKQFIDFPHDLYEKDAYYVPELYIGQKELLSPKKNPFFKHSKLSLFLAKKENKIVGRIAAIRNNNHNVAYTMTPEGANKRSIRLANAVEERLKRKNIVIRCVNMKDFKNEAQKIKDVYNKAWEKNWGFVPATDEEFAHLAEGLKLVIDPDFVYVAEHEGEAIGFSLTLPDINQIVKTMKKGRLLPFGIFKLLFQKKKINRVRVITLGVVEEYRKMGIEAVFYAKNIQTALDKKIKSAEASWVLEDNPMMNKALVDLNATVYKRYRVFQKTI